MGAQQQQQQPACAVWQIRLAQLSANPLEAHELAGVLQEATQDNIQVTGWRAVTRQPSISGGAAPLPFRERIRRAEAIPIGAGTVPWHRLAAVACSDVLEPSSPTAAGQQQQLTVDFNSGGSVFFLLFSQQDQHSRLSQQGQQHPQQAPRAEARQRSAGAQEGVAVLKVGASRLAMQAEQFANELSRHLGIAAPDCRVVRQVGSSAEEWAASLAAAQRLAEPAASSGSGGCAAASGLLSELSQLPCFLLMEFVEGRKLSECPHALDPAVSDVGLLCEDVGRLFLLDMLLGNADRMPCPELGWRGNPNNLLMALPGSRHAGRIVAIDSCVARRPPAQKASAEDAAVERLAQLMLAVPDVSRSLLQQLLGDVRRQQQQQEAGADQAPEAGFSDADVARFQAGLRQCLDGVLNIKGLLEMVSTHIAEWIAAFVEDVVRLNPALLPAAAAVASPAAPAAAALRSPRPSPRPSRSHINTAHGGSGNSSSSSSSADSRQAAELAGARGDVAADAAAGSTDSKSATGDAEATASFQVVDAASDSKTPQPHLANRFASIKAAVCSSASSSVSSGSEHGRSNSNSSASAGGGLSVAPPLSPPPPAIAAGQAAADAQHGASGPAAAPAAGCVLRTSSGELALAVAAVLSPRANPEQRQALEEVFGGGSSGGGAASGSGSRGLSLKAAALRGGVSSFTAGSLSARGGGGSAGPPSAQQRLSSARRMTWSNEDQVPAPLYLGDDSPAMPEPPPRPAPLKLPQPGGSAATAVASPVPAPRPSKHSAGGFSSGGGSSSQRVRPGSTSPRPGQLPSSAAVATPFSFDVASSSSSRGGVPGAFASPPRPSWADRASRGGGGGGASSPPSAAAAAAAATGGAGHVATGRSSSSSLQALAGLQLDATLASITHEARHDNVLAERLAHWRAVFRDRGCELTRGIAAWQQRHELAAVLSTGFLDGRSHAIADCYELGVRLQHMLRRLAALAAGALVQAPTCVVPRVFLGGAVAADSHHLLQHLGVTHVVNAAQELQLAPDPGLFSVLRVGIRDDEEEDVAAHFEPTRAWIDAALASPRGGAVLVHCHEGKSRSVTLLLAYLMLSKGMTLAAALELVRAVRPAACPNAGFMQQLMRLDVALHGGASLSRSELPRAKPEARVCTICGVPVGVSHESLLRHIKAKHGLSKPCA